MSAAQALFRHIDRLSNLNLVPRDFVARQYYEKKGRFIYKTDSEMRDVCTVMEHPEFFQFYYKYMRDFEKFKRTLVLLRLYEIISRKFQQTCPGAHNAYHKLFFLYNLMRDPDLRRILFSNIKLEDNDKDNDKHDRLDYKGPYPAICKQSDTRPNDRD